MSKEILLVVEAVSNEKDVPKQVIFEAVETALASAAKRRYEGDVKIRVSIDQRTGEYKTYRQWDIVQDEDYSAPDSELTTDDMEEQGLNLGVGDIYEEEIESEEFGRIAAQTAKQVIVQKVREAERAKMVARYSEKVGKLVHGQVKKVTRDSLIIDLGENAEAVLPKESLINRETFRMNDRIRALLLEIREDNRGSQLILSRTAPEFMVELFRLEVPEIAEEVIEIRGASRDPGLRAKIAVKTSDRRIDPIGACVGMRGSRVQAVVNELQGEKIDIIPWNEDQPTFLVNALQPAEVSKVVLDEEAGKIEVVVPEEQLSLAIGRRGQNVRLASQLTNLDIDIMTEEEESARRQKEFEARTQLFMETLDLDEFFAQLLVSEGFTNLEEVAYVELDELLVIDGVDEGTAQELQARAADYLEAQAKAAIDAARALGVEDSLIDFDGLTPQMIEALAKDGIKTLEDFATCADWELAGGWTSNKGERVKDDGILEPFDVSLEDAQNLVMTARVLLGWVDPAELEAEAEDDADIEDNGEAEAEA